MKLQFPEKFRTVYDFTQDFSFFWTGCYAFPLKFCILNKLQLQRSPYQKIKGLLIVHECLWAGQISHASNFSYFNVLNQSHLVLSKNEIHQLLPYIFKRQP